MPDKQSNRIFGWVVEIRQAAPAAPLLFNVAEPSQSRAVELVRLHRPEVEGGTVEAKTPLSAHTVYIVLRMKRGRILRIE